MSEFDMNRDHKRFKDVIRGKVRKDLKKYVSQGENIVKRYKDEEGNEREKVLVPMPRVDTPHFRFNDKQAGGVGQGKGEEGDPLSGEEGDDPGKAGDKPGEHGLEEFAMEEIVDMIIDECELPDLAEKSKKFIIDMRNVYRGIQRNGPKGLLHKKRTFKNTLKRQLGEGTYDPKNPVLIPERPDHRFKGPKQEIIEGMQAVVFYIMDYSGSMGEEQKEMARILMFWLSRCIRRFYKNIEEVFIIHDTEAKEVDRDTFFSSTSSGGTYISSALKLISEIQKDRYPANDYNIYPFVISDGGNWDNDNAGCKNWLQYHLLDLINMIGYTQVKSSYGNNVFKDMLEGNFSGEMKRKIRTASMDNKGDTMQAIKQLLGKKK
jgi:hypothetical protein